MLQSDLLSESPLMKEIGGFIGGETISQGKAPPFPVRNPADGEILAYVPTFGKEEAAEAVRCAASFLREKGELPLGERKLLLTSIHEKLLKFREELARIITLENGKPLWESFAEIDYAASFFRVAAERVEELSPHTLSQAIRGCRWSIYRRPAGVAALITPWNFPLAMLAKKLAGAFGAGCPVVVKPSEETPLTTIALSSIFKEIGLPKGLWNLVFGKAQEIGEVFCSAPEVRVISFTGSTETGKLLASQAAPYIKRLTLELGGNAPFLVFADADLDSAVSELLKNKFRCSGQTCVCTNRVLLEERIAENFIEKLIKQVKDLRVGPGLQEGTQIGPLINRQAFDKVCRHVEDAMEKGSKCLLGGIPKPPEGEGGFFFPPTILTNVSSQMLLWREETFGPVIAVATFKEEEEALRLAEDTTHGLSAYLFTSDSKRIARILPRLSFGHVGINTATGPTAEAPFGGWKLSGYGREGALEGILEFTEIQVAAQKG